MPVPSTLADLSTTAASNSPPGSEAVGTNIDNYLRAGFAFIKQLEAGATSVAAGLVKSSGTALSVASAGTDYLAPAAIGTTVQAYDADIPTVAASQAEMEAGTESALRSMSPLRVKQAIDALATPVQVSKAVSADQTYSTGGQYIFAHGLGAVPTHVQVYLVATPAGPEGNYSIGDVLAIPFSGSANGEFAVSAVIDATNVTVRMGATETRLMNKSTGGTFVMTPSYWKLRVVASLIA